MKILFKLIFLVVFALLASCSDNTLSNNDSPQLLKPSMFLKNVIIYNDTVLLDKNFDVDCRVEIPGYKINRISFSNFNRFDDTCVVTMNMFRIQQNNQFNVTAEVSVTNTKTLERSIITSNPFVIKVVDDLNNLYVKKDCVDGKLKLSWPELDKSNTKSYIIEKYIGDVLIEENEVVGDSCFVDQTYVGEEVIYKISTLNKDNVIQQSFGFIKAKEIPEIRIEQHAQLGYTMYWSKNKYYSNFKDYNLIQTNSYSGDKTLMTSENINDTSLYMPNASFSAEVRFYLVQSPKIKPTFITENQKDIYSYFIYRHYGIPSVRYENMVVLDQNTFVYTLGGKIYKYNTLSNKTTDSIVNKNVTYADLRMTPTGKYIYANNSNLGVTFFDFWKSDKFVNSPLLTFDTSYQTYCYTDELTGIASIKNNSPYMYYITTKNLQTNQVINQTEIKDGGGYGMCISSNGEYLIGQNPNCSLFHFKDTTWTKVWGDTQITTYKTFYSFDPQDPTRLYLYNNEIFSIISLNDYSIIKSYPLPNTNITNIDFYTGKMLVVTTGKYQVIKIETGEIVKEIPFSYYDTFSYNSSVRLMGNVIYCNQGVKYILE